MKDIESFGVHLRYLDELALGRTWLHCANPGMKLAATMLFIIIVASFPRYAVFQMVPLVCYPLIWIILGDLPVGCLLKQVGWAVPLVFGVAIFNPLLDRAPLLYWGGLAVSGGWIAFATIMLKFGLTALAGLLLIATTGLNSIGAALQNVGVPRFWTEQLMFVYRYLFVLLEEVSRTVRAYGLRAGKQQGVTFRAWGSLMGHLLLRTLERSGRIYQAMQCRGYRGEIRMVHPRPMSWSDGLFLGVWILFLLLIRWVNLPQWIGDWGWRLLE